MLAILKDIYPRYKLKIGISPLQWAQGRDITYSSPNLSKVIVALPSKIADDEFPAEFRHVIQKNVSLNNNVSPSSQLQYHPLQSFRSEKDNKDENKFSCLLIIVICNAGRTLVVGHLSTVKFCHPYKNEIFRGEFCTFNSSKPLLCQVCHPYTVQYYSIGKKFFLETIIKKVGRMQNWLLNSQTSTKTKYQNSCS